jgi:AraC family transcriptional regulator
MMTENLEFQLRSPHGVRTVQCDSRVWNAITVRHVINHAKPGRVWHNISSAQMTVAVLLDQVGGICDTRFHVNRPLNRNRHGVGQIDFVPAGTTVWGYSDGLRSTRGLRLYFDVDKLEDLLGDDLDLARTTTPLLMQYDDRIARCASLLAEECRTGSFGTFYGESLTLALMAALFAPSTHANQTTRYGLARWQLRRAIEYFEEHLSHQLSLSDVARQLGLSQSRFALGFRLSTGMPPYHWFTEARVKKAQELLLQRKEPIATIAIQSGFADQSHLTKAFRRSTARRHACGNATRFPEELSKTGLFWTDPSQTSLDGNGT